MLSIATCSETLTDPQGEVAVPEVVVVEVVVVADVEVADVEVVVAAAEGEVEIMSVETSAVQTTKTVPVLGAGLSFREPLLGDLFQRRRDVDFLEIIADRYLDASLEKLRELDLLTRNFPLIPHGLSL